MRAAEGTPMKWSQKTQRLSRSARIASSERARIWPSESRKLGAPGARPSSVELTPRECEVLRLMADGYASKQIAEELKISVNTVNNHRASIYAKLGVHSATAAVKWCCDRWPSSHREPPLTN